MTVTPDPHQARTLGQRDQMMKSELGPRIMSPDAAINRLAVGYFRGLMTAQSQRQFM